MSSVGVYILTTGAPVRIEKIHVRRRPPRSEITVGQDYTQRLPASKDYDLFVSGNGPLGQAFEQTGDKCYRLQVSSNFDDGNSWEFACFLAHALARQGRLASVNDVVEEVVMASGRVDLAYDIGAVEHIKLKLNNAREIIARWQEKSVPVKLLLPASIKGAAPHGCLNGAKIYFCSTVADVMDLFSLPWSAPKKFNPLTLLTRLERRRRTAVLSIILTLAILALGVTLINWRQALDQINFQLSSDRGYNATYRIGDKLNLIIQTDRDAWVYCYYFEADGKMFAILPNPKFWTRTNEPKFTGGAVHRIPGETTYPFDLVLREPVGTERIKCFAVSRDVTKELPAPLRGLTWTPIASYFGNQLSKIFRGLPETAVTEASLTVKVLPAPSP